MKYSARYTCMPIHLMLLGLLMLALIFHSSSVKGDTVDKLLFPWNGNFSVNIKEKNPSTTRSGLHYYDLQHMLAIPQEL